MTVRGATRTRHPDPPDQQLFTLRGFVLLAVAVGAAYLAWRMPDITQPLVLGAAAYSILQRVVR